MERQLVWGHGARVLCRLWHVTRTCVHVPKAAKVVFVVLVRGQSEQVAQELPLLPRHLRRERLVLAVRAVGRMSAATFALPDAAKVDCTQAKHRERTRETGCPRLALASEDDERL